MLTTLQQLAGKPTLTGKKQGDTSLPKGEALLGSGWQSRTKRGAGITRTSDKGTYGRWAKVSRSQQKGRHRQGTGCKGVWRLLACTRNAAHPQQGAQDFEFLFGPAYSQGCS